MHVADVMSEVGSTDSDWSLEKNEFFADLRLQNTERYKEPHLFDLTNLIHVVILRLQKFFPKILNTSLEICDQFHPESSGIES